MSSDYYNIVYPGFWTGLTGQQIRAGGRDVQVLAMYLISNGHGSMLGLYRLLADDIVVETGMDLGAIAAAFDYLGKIDFAHYDATTQHVWVKKMVIYRLGLKYGAPLKLAAKVKVNGKMKQKAEDRRIPAVQGLYARLDDNPFLLPFFVQYAKVLHLKVKRQSKPLSPVSLSSLITARPHKGHIRPFGAPYMPLLYREKANGTARAGVNARSPFPAPTKPGTGTGTGTEDPSSTSNEGTSGIPPAVPPEYIVTGAAAPAHTRPVENTTTEGAADGADARGRMETALRDRGAPARGEGTVSRVAHGDGPRLVRVGRTHQAAPGATPTPLPGPAPGAHQGDGGVSSRLAETRGAVGTAAVGGGAAPPAGHYAAPAPASERAAERRSAVAEEAPVYGGGGDMDGDRNGEQGAGNADIRRVIATIRANTEPAG